MSHGWRRVYTLSKLSGHGPRAGAPLRHMAVRRDRRRHLILTVFVRLDARVMAVANAQSGHRVCLVAE